MHLSDAVAVVEGFWGPMNELNETSHPTRTDAVRLTALIVTHAETPVAARKILAMVDGYAGPTDAAIAHAAEKLSRC